MNAAKTDYPSAPSGSVRSLGLSGDELAARRKGIFASDSPSILLGGDEAFGSRFSVWAEKCLPMRPTQPTQQMLTGLALEPSILSWAERFLDREVVRKPAIYPTGEGDDIFGAHLDGALAETDKQGRRAVVEAKCSAFGKWGDPGTDQIPSRYLVQTQHQMMVADAQVAYVPVLLMQLGVMEMYVVERDDELIGEIRDEDLQFWNDHVRTGQRPDGEPDPELIARIERDDDAMPRIGTVPFEVVDAWELAKQNALCATKAASTARNALLAYGADKDFLDYEGGTIHVKRESCGWRISGDNLKKLRLHHPDIFKRYATEPTKIALRPRKENR